MSGDNVIKITEQTPIGEVSREFTQEQFARRVIELHHAGRLGEFMNEAGLTFPEVLDYIGPETFSSLPEKAVFSDGTEFDPQEYLLHAGKDYTPAQEPKTEVEKATQGHSLADMSLEQLAANSDSMSTPELEKALADAGMLQHRSSLMR